MPAVLSAALQAARCGYLPGISLPVAIEDGPDRAAGSGIAEGQAVVRLILPGHQDFDHFMVWDAPDADGN